MSNLIERPEARLAESTKTIFPLLIYKAGERAQYKFVEYFTNTIENENTRTAYARACVRFFEWCEGKGFTLETVHPVAAASYFRGLELSALSIKQHLAAVRGLYNWFVVEGVVSFNPVSSVRGPKVSYRKGKTPVLSAEETRRLLNAPDPNTLKGIRDRAVLGVLFYAWVRSSAVVNLDIRDYRQQGRRSFLRFREKGGRVHEVPTHHRAQNLLDEYLAKADIDLTDNLQSKLPLFRTFDRRRVLSKARMSRQDVTRLVKRYAELVGVSAEVSAHSARATGITNYLDNGGAIEVAQDIAGHADARTTRLYDRSRDKVTLSELERVRY